MTFNHPITIVQDPLDCSGVLVLSFTNPFPTGISYNSAGSVVDIATTYQNVFTHVANADCQMTGCRALASDCLSPLATQTHVVFGTTPDFKL